MGNAIEAKINEILAWINGYGSNAVRLGYAPELLTCRATPLAMSGDQLELMKLLRQLRELQADAEADKSERDAIRMNTDRIAAIYKRSAEETCRRICEEINADAADKRARESQEA